MVIQEKWEEGWAPYIKGCIHLFTFIYIYNFLARIVFLIGGTILSSRQIVTCTQHFSFNNKLSFSRNATMSINHCTFSQHYSMLITHCILCRNLVFWKKNSIIEQRLNDFLKGKLHFSIKEHCMFSSIFGRNTGSLNGLQNLHDQTHCMLN